VLIHFVGPGEMYGIAAVFLPTGHPADAFAITDCTDLRWSAKTMTELMMAYPCIALNAININFHPLPGDSAPAAGNGPPVG
jgi:CRP-like cAMP-binding protein